MEIFKELPLPLQKHIYEYRVQPIRDAHYKPQHKEKFNHCLLALNNGHLDAVSMFKTLYHADHLTQPAFLYRINFCDCLDYIDVDDY